MAAVDRLQARRKFQETGVARLYLRIPSHDEAPEHVDVRLSTTIEQLRKTIGGMVGWDWEECRLVMGGRVLEEAGQSLESAEVGAGSELLVLRTEEEAEAKWRRELDRARAAAHRLGGNEGDRSLEIRDQTGRRLQLPLEERRSLAVAMALSEKGRGAVRQRRWSRALLALLEADEAFGGCRSELLGAVDNYALLQLDIVWCYLQLQSMRNLPDAAKRLRDCDAAFTRSYGANLERVARLKDSVDLERGLLLRLRLLQGVLAYHQGANEEARRRLAEVERWMAEMRVSSESIQTMMEMGFEEAES